ncbi:MAG: hypothetical protein KIG36_05600 [Eubacteriales bacterium]|nr:hypothetical protein [Eubacteriales bacterium]
MIYQKDWFMRQIAVVIEAIGQTVFRREKIEYPERAGEQTAGDLLHRKLLGLLEEGKICEAEDLLFEKLDERDPQMLEAAVDFYRTLNLMDDEALERQDFSRREIADGLGEVLARFELREYGFALDTIQLEWENASVD